MAERRRWNPLRSEQEAFHFLIAAMGYFGSIALAAALGGLWVGIAVFAVLTAAGAAWFLNRNRRLEPPEPVGSKETHADEHRSSS